MRIENSDTLQSPLRIHSLTVTGTYKSRHFNSVFSTVYRASAAVICSIASRHHLWGRHLFRMRGMHIWGTAMVSVQAMVVGGRRKPPGIECPKFAVGTLRLPAIICTIRFFPTVALHTDSDGEEFERPNLNLMSSDVEDMAQILNLNSNSRIEKRDLAGNLEPQSQHHPRRSSAYNYF
jgi:hypothetical protein